MGPTGLRRRHSALAAGLATVAIAVGFAASPAGAAPPEVDYVALGDSYTAGTGAGAPYRPAEVACWRSSPGYVDLVGGTGRVNLVANAACHGAVLADDSDYYDRAIITPTVMEQIVTADLAGQLSGDTELVSLTAGANDLGFATVLGACAGFTQEACAVELAKSQSPRIVSQMQSNLVDALVAIRAAAPNAKIVLMSYPRLFEGTSNFPVPLENQLAINDAADGLNAVLASTVQAVGAVYGNMQFVDVTARFIDHAANSTDPWLHLVLVQPIPDYNFHPNKAGHRAYASALLASVKLGQLVRP